MELPRYITVITLDRIKVLDLSKSCEMDIGPYRIVKHPHLPMCVSCDNGVTTRIHMYPVGHKYLFENHSISLYSHNGGIQLILINQYQQEPIADEVLLAEFEGISKTLKSDSILLQRCVSHYQTCVTERQERIQRRTLCLAGYTLDPVCTFRDLPPEMVYSIVDRV